MDRLFSTSDVHPRDRFAYWHSVACQRIVQHDSAPVSRESFHAELSCGELGSTVLVQFENSPMSISHTLRHASGSASDVIFLCHQLAGTLAVEQAGRDVVLNPGQVTLLDPRLSYSGRFVGDSKLLVLKVCRRSLEARIGPARNVIAYPLNQTFAENNLLSAYLSALPTTVGRLSPLAQELAEDQVLDLIAMAIAKTTEGERPRISSARSVVRLKVRTAIEQHLCEPGLETVVVAAAAGVSVRYANDVLADEGTSIARLILAMRLRRCRLALEDPLQTKRNVSEIAQAWGFSDMTHFARRYKEAYGVLPSEVRKAHREKHSVQ